jgi:cytochrome P450 family 135
VAAAEVTSDAVRLPPGPQLPRALLTLAFLLSPPRFMDACRRRYGDVVFMSTAFDSGFVLVFDPEVVREVFRAPPERLRAGEANAVLAPLLGERSVLLLDGSEHLRQRRLLLPPFHGKRLQAHQDVMRDAADAQIDAWPRGEPFALLPSMQALTLEVIMTAIFGVEQGARREELKRRIRAALEPLRGRRARMLVLALSAGRFGDRGAMARFQAQRRALDEAIYSEIERRRAADDLDERDDVMSMLLQARHEDGEPMTNQELRDELVTLLVAGHETTATGLAWTFDLVLHTPRVLERLQRDADPEYVEAVVKESLRLRPVVPGVGRVVRGGPYELAGYVLPTGTEINPSISMIHRRSDRYPSPADFRPERFLGPDAPDTYTWLPFGGGTRRCLGASFALQEMRIVLTRVLERVTLRPAGSRPSKVRRQGITLVPADGVRVVAHYPEKQALAAPTRPRSAASRV